MRFYARLNDIRNADFTSPTDCPIARAIKRKLPKLRLSVGPFDIKYGNLRKIEKFPAVLQALSDKMAEYTSFTEGFHFHLNLKA